ncbi:MAG: glycosyltransferase family 9 protein [Actinobacteria bacterium]|nr:glycosyltransferase family 9 protein [Actinomycetota bacterium]
MTVARVARSRAGAHVLLARLDNAGDVLLTGPAVRAVAATAGRVTFLCGPRGRAAAELLPGVDDVVVHRAPWIDHDRPPVERDAELGLADRVAALGVEQAAIFTSFHQSALPLALLLRFAGVATIAAISEDFPGSLIDVRHRVDDDIHEVERNLSLVATLGYRLTAGDDGRLAVRRRHPRRANPAGQPGYVVVHPGASVPARAWAPQRHEGLVDALLDEGWRVVVTGGPAERELTRRIAGGRAGGDRGAGAAGGRAGADRVAGAAGGRSRLGVTDLGARTDLAAFAEVLAEAAAVVTGNTGPAHLAAAVGTPVVEVFAPTVPAVRWRPWGVRHEILGDQTIACAGCRATVCPQPGHPCIGTVTIDDVIDALRRVLADPDATAHPVVTGRP